MNLRKIIQEELEREEDVSLAIQATNRFLDLIRKKKIKKVQVRASASFDNQDLLPRIRYFITKDLIQTIFASTDVSQNQIQLTVEFGTTSCKEMRNSDEECSGFFRRGQEHFGSHLIYIQLDDKEFEDLKKYDLIYGKTRSLLVHEFYHFYDSFYQFYSNKVEWEQRSHELNAELSNFFDTFINNLGSHMYNIIDDERLSRDDYDINTNGSLIDIIIVAYYLLDKFDIYLSDLLENYLHESLYNFNLYLNSSKEIKIKFVKNVYKFIQNIINKTSLEQKLVAFQRISPGTSKKYIENKIKNRKTQVSNFYGWDDLE